MLPVIVTDVPLTVLLVVETVGAAGVVVVNVPLGP